MRYVSARVLLVAGVFILGLLTPSIEGRAQKAQQQPTFRVRVEYVEVDAVVRDKQGNFIADLTKGDFEVLEDGKPQTIERIELVNVPVEPRPAVALVTRREIEPDVVSNAAAPGRLYLIVLDDLHIYPQRTIPARKIAREFVERTLAPNDMAAVVTTSGNRSASQDFTNNRRLLLKAIDSVVGRKMMTAGQSNIANDLSALDPNATRGLNTPAAPPDPGARERLHNAQSALDTLTGLATLAGTIRNRRKGMVLVSEGVGYSLSGPTFKLMEEATADRGVGPADEGTASRALRENLRSFVDAANRANLTLYAFDPRIYTQGGDDLVDIASGYPSANRDAGSKTEPESTTVGTMWDDIITSRDNLQLMSTETGGFATTGSLQAADNAFVRIRDESSHYYILGYYPTNEKNDGKFRKIEVRCKRTGVTVLARRGYVAPKNEKAPVATVVTKEGTSAPLKDAIMSALPTLGLPIHVTAVPYRGTGNSHSVLVMMQTPPGAVKFVEKGGKYEGNLEVSFVAMDNKNKTQGGEHLNLSMPLKPETFAAVSRSGLLVQSRVSLAPGRYVLRVGARDENTERVGSVHCDVEVPDFGDLPLSMSGLLIASAETAIANPRPDPELRKMLPDQSPTLVRDFRASDQLSVLAEIYDRKVQTPHDVDITVTVVGEDGKERYHQEQKLSTSQLQGTNGGFGYLLKVPLAGMEPGGYLMRVEARSRLDVDKPVSRETMFRIVGR